MRFKATYLLAGVTALVLSLAAIAFAAKTPSTQPKSIVLGKTTNYPNPGHRPPSTTYVSNPC